MIVGIPKTRIILKNSFCITRGLLTILSQSLISDVFRYLKSSKKLSKINQNPFLEGSWAILGPRPGGRFFKHLVTFQGSILAKHQKNHNVLFIQLPGWCHIRCYFFHNIEATLFPLAAPNFSFCAWWRLFARSALDT